MFAYLYIKNKRNYKIMEYTVEDYDILYGLDVIQTEILDTVPVVYLVS
jgi:hypothetical protein